MIIALVWLHFVCDFILQTDKMALSKSKSYSWLLIHVVVYSLPFLYFGWKFALFNGAAHFITDAITSRVSGYFWKKGDRHHFFVVIGCDQAIHMTCLIASLDFFVR